MGMSLGSDRLSRPDSSGVTAEALPDSTWDQLVASVKQDSPPLGAHLGKLQAELHDDKLTIWAKTKFIKNIIDKGLLTITKHLPENTAIEVLAEMKPSRDDRIAKISAIMGGAEEVNIDGAAE